MKLLFLTTYKKLINADHFFTRNVWKGLCGQFCESSEEIVLATIIVDHQYLEPSVTEEEYNGKRYYKLYYSPLLSDEEKVEEITRFFRYIAPDIIHSNMVEVIDVEAAKKCNIPIVLTIHIGGFICPRSGGNGFLKFDDSICDTRIGEHCFRCCAQDFPLPVLARFLYWSIPTRLREWAYYKLRNKQIFYLTQFLIKSHEIVQRQKAIETYKYATIIAANQRLKEILALNGLKDNVVLLPHGVELRPRIPLSEVKDVVKFYYLGRIDYGKGLHNLLKAFDGIDNSLYELHIIGGCGSISGVSRRDKRYEEYLKHAAKDKNVIFHGRIPNTEIGLIIKDMHVMIHPTICMEVYGISIAESLSIGRPILATRCGGAEMQIKEGVNGWLVKPNAAIALKNKIKKIIMEKKEIELMSENCKLPHPISEYCRHLLNIYKIKANEKTVR